MKPTIKGLLGACCIYGVDLRADETGQWIDLTAPVDPPEALIKALIESKPMLLEFLTKERGYGPTG